MSFFVCIESYRTCTGYKTIQERWAFYVLLVRYAVILIEYKPNYKIESICKKKTMHTLFSKFFRRDSSVPLLLASSLYSKTSDDYKQHAAASSFTLYPATGARFHSCSLIGAASEWRQIWRATSAINIHYCTITVH